MALGIVLFDACADINPEATGINGVKFIVLVVHASVFNTDKSAIADVIVIFSGEAKGIIKSTVSHMMSQQLVDEAS